MQSRSAMWILSFVLLGIVALVPATLMPAVLAPEHPALAIFTAIGLFAAMMAGVLLESLSRVRVGDDGILVRRRFGRRFIPFADLADVREVDGVVIRFVLRSGGCIDLYTGRDEQLVKPAYVRACDELVGRVRTGLASWQARDGARVDAGDALRERACGSLRGELHAARTPYRAIAPPSPDELARIVSAETAEPTARAAAAVLLRGQARAANDPNRARLRIALHATAHPELRKLLRVAIDDAPDETVLAALEEVERAAGGAGEKRRRRPKTAS